MRVNLALLFAWRDVAKARMASSTNLLILDETMDSSLDGVGIENFFKLLGKLGDTENIFVISHRPDLVNTNKFDRALQFTKTKNFSKMKELA